MSTERVAVILHPLNIENFLNNFTSFYHPWSIFIKPLLSSFSRYTIKSIFKSFPPHEFMRVKILTDRNRSLELIGIMCPLFPEQMMLEKPYAQEMIKRSVALAAKKKVSIATLAGFTSIVTDGGLDLLQDARIAITSGNSLTALLCIKGIEEAVLLSGRRLDDLVVAIVGATGDIGSVCAQVLIKKAKTMILCSRSIAQESEVVRQMSKGNEIKLKIESDPRKAVQGADVVLAATSAISEIFDVSDFKRGAIVCDTSMPPSISRNSKKRMDIIAFEGGRARLSFYNSIKNKKWQALFPNNSIYGCLAESLALALDGQMESFSLGKGRLSEDHLTKIKAIADKHGITLSEFYSNGELVPTSSFSRLGGTMK